MTKVLIAGCGDVGASLGKALIERGDYVVGLRRHPPIEKSGINFIAVDLTNPATLRELDADFDQIFFMAAPKEHDLHAYKQIYEVGLENLICKFSESNHNPHWILISSTSVYGQVDGGWIDETSITEPRRFNGQLQLSSEQRILSENKSNLIVRFSGIYGPGRNRLLRIAQKGGPIQHKPPYYTNRIHKDDCVGVLKFLLEQRLGGKNLHSHYLASDDQPAPMWEVITWIANKLKYKQPDIKPEETNTAQNKRCCNKRLKELGYHFKYPSYIEGYQKVINGL